VDAGVEAAGMTTNDEKATMKLHVYLTLGSGKTVYGAEGVTSAGAT
jgi:hypothetical protein